MFKYFSVITLVIGYITGQRGHLWEEEDEPVKQNADPGSGWRSGLRFCQRQLFIQLKAFLEASSGLLSDRLDGWEIASAKGAVTVGASPGLSLHPHVCQCFWRGNKLVSLAKNMDGFSFAVSSVYCKNVKLGQEYCYCYYPWRSSKLILSPWR